MMRTVVFDTKRYGRVPTPARSPPGLDIEWRFTDWRLSLPDTALT